MISNNVYLRFETLDNEESVLSFIKEESAFKSNSKTWKEDVNKLMRYKKKHLRNYSNDNQYRNIFGYYLKVMIPHEMEKREEEFVRNVMHQIDKRFIRNLYLFKTSKQGNGYYAEIICFSRYVLKRPTNRVKKYNRDFYYNSKTGKMCKKDHPDAVLKGKKGDPVLDKDGNQVKELVEVRAVEDRIFVYKTIQGLTARLKRAIASVVMIIKNNYLVTRIVSRITVEDDDCMSMKRYKFNRNKMIRKVNDVLERFVYCMIQGNLADTEEIIALNEVWCEKANSMIHQENKQFEEVQSALYDLWNKEFVVGMF